MFNQYNIVYGQQIQTYTLALMIGTVLSILWLIMTAPEGQLSATFDSCLAGLIGAIIFARAFHVALNWIYFSENLNMISHINEQGGLNWHGALLGAFLFGSIMAKWRRLNFSLNRLSPILPLIAFAGWYGAGAAASAYGTRVEHMADYPAFLTWIERDIYGLIAPRFAVQPLGMAWTGFVFLLALILHRFEKRRLPVIVFLLCVGSLGLAFLRGDYALMLAGLRAEQWLDLVFAGITIFLLFRGIQDFSSLSASSTSA
jgi:prolipoprotein diacylglyceryltransferase